jgi:hypothetical protein
LQSEIIAPGYPSQGFVVAHVGALQSCSCGRDWPAPASSETPASVAPPPLLPLPLHVLPTLTAKHTCAPGAKQHCVA